jgi:hypothetical protein
MGASSLAPSGLSVELGATSSVALNEGASSIIANDPATSASPRSSESEVDFEVPEVKSVFGNIH